MNRPIVRRADIESVLAQYRLTFAETPVIALGLRGAFDKGANTIGGFDDALVVCTPAICEAFTGNTDPSSEIPNRANLVTGISWFRPGFHHLGTPKQYAAFVQDGPIIVSRWQTDDVPAGTKDARGECRGGGLWKGLFAIHMHDAGGVNTTGSEGCQTAIKTEWPAYHTLLMDELRRTLPPELAALSTDELCRRGIPRFPYLLVDTVKATRAAQVAA